MDAFSYLSVLLSIIVGLAITQVLQGYRALLLSRHTVRFYMPPLLWSAIVLAMATQMWWSSFGLAHHTNWTFGTFATVLLQTVLLYMLAAVVLPDVPRGEPIDLAEHYARETTPLFAVLLAMLAVSVAKETMLEGRLPLPENLAFHVAFGAMALVGLLFRRRRVHEVLAVATAVVLAVYVALLFARL